MARKHGEQAVAYAEEAGQHMLEWSAHWGLALLAGLSVDAPALVTHVKRSDELAERVS